MYYLFITLCLLGGGQCIDDNKLIVKSEKNFNTVHECKLYADTTFIDLAEREYREKWKIFGSICIHEKYTDVLKGKNYKILKEGTNV